METVITATIGLPTTVAVSIGVLYVAYVVAMYFQRLEEDRALRPHEVALKHATGWFTIILSVLFNFTFASLLFLDPPKLETFSSRMSRYAYEPKYFTNWRRDVARWLEANVFDPHDPGHLKP